jgi:hypothetical protein
MDESAPGSVHFFGAQAASLESIVTGARSQMRSDRGTIA